MARTVTQRCRPKEIRMTRQEGCSDRRVVDSLRCRRWRLERKTAVLKRRRGYRIHRPINRRHAAGVISVRRMAVGQRHRDVDIQYSPMQVNDETAKRGRQTIRPGGRRNGVGMHFTINVLVPVMGTRVMTVPRVITPLMAVGDGGRRDPPAQHQGR